jgi:hypothetical protein
VLNMICYQKEFYKTHSASKLKQLMMEYATRLDITAETLKELDSNDALFKPFMDAVTASGVRRLNPGAAEFVPRGGFRPLGTRRKGLKTRPRPRRRKTQRRR